ncbi:hypothetical protein [Diplocloster modestus]|uniref:Uncharacterized protein n=1 Tax=Diplocloster modestus TaxID=2850322 RepID=A0ABS6K6L5_9FIRM|nr:hypothetical protein [Diplocloster modestus]MBU9726155.1 hypothetical protein [Diplocloster modestus]
MLTTEEQTGCTGTTGGVKYQGADTLCTRGRSKTKAQPARCPLCTDVTYGVPAGERCLWSSFSHKAPV